MVLGRRGRGRAIQAPGKVGRGLRPIPSFVRVMFTLQGLTAYRVSPWSMISRKHVVLDY